MSEPDKHLSCSVGKKLSTSRYIVAFAWDGPKITTLTKFGLRNVINEQILTQFALNG